MPILLNADFVIGFLANLITVISFILMCYDLYARKKDTGNTVLNVNVVLSEHYICSQEQSYLLHNENTNTECSCFEKKTPPPCIDLFTISVVIIFLALLINSSERIFFILRNLSLAGLIASAALGLFIFVKTHKEFYSVKKQYLYFSSLIVFWALCIIAILKTDGPVSTNGIIAKGYEAVADAVLYLMSIAAILFLSIRLIINAIKNFFKDHFLWLDFCVYGGYGVIAVFIYYAAMHTLMQKCSAVFVWFSNTLTS